MFMFLYLSRTNRFHFVDIFNDMSTVAVEGELSIRKNIGKYGVQRGLECLEALKSKFDRRKIRRLK